MTANIKIRTNNVPRDVIDAWELTAEERKEFDYLSWESIEMGEDSASFFRYRGELYDLGEFMITSDFPDDDPMRKWSGFWSDSFFSGLLIRWPRVDGGCGGSPDFHKVVVALYTC